MSIKQLKCADEFMFDNECVTFSSPHLSDDQCDILSQAATVKSYLLSDKRLVVIELSFTCNVFNILFDEYDSWAFSPMNINITYSLHNKISKVIHMQDMMLRSRIVKDHVVTLVFVSSYE